MDKRLCASSYELRVRRGDPERPPGPPSRWRGPTSPRRCPRTPRSSPSSTAAPGGPSMPPSQASRPSSSWPVLRRSRAKGPFRLWRLGWRITRRAPVSDRSGSQSLSRPFTPARTASLPAPSGASRSDRYPERRGVARPPRSRRGPARRTAPPRTEAARDKSGERRRQRRIGEGLDANLVLHRPEDQSLAHMVRGAAGRLQKQGRGPGPDQRLGSGVGTGPERQSEERTKATRCRMAGSIGGRGTSGPTGAGP